MVKVYLVGAGPGDPELITVKGFRLIKEADLIVYDRLVSKELLKHAKKEAELIYVGKERGKHTLKQEDINKLLVEKAKSGKYDVIVRLKGGDPFVFGRLTEEIKALNEAGIEWEVVPGITSAIAVPGLAGIPVTDRRLSSSFTVVTGQEDPTKKEKKVDFSKFNADTIIILMGVKNLEKIVKELLKSRKKDTPVAIIEKGSTEEERVIEGSLENIVSIAKEKEIKPPAIIVVGDVVRLRKEILSKQS